MGIRYRNYAHYTLYRSCLPIYVIAIVRSLSFLFLDDFEGNAKVSVPIKSGSTVVELISDLTGAKESITKTNNRNLELKVIITQHQPQRLQYWRVAGNTFLFLVDFEGNANISVAIKSGPTVTETLSRISDDIERSGIL